MSLGKSFTPAQLARLGGVSAATVRRWIRRGIICGDYAQEGPPRFGFADVARVRSLASLRVGVGRRSWVLGAAARGARLRELEGAIVEVDDDGVWDPQTGQGVLPFLPRTATVAWPREDDHGEASADAWFDQALELESTDPSRAKSLLREVAERGGHARVNAYLHLARLHEAEGDVSTAIAHLEGLLADDPATAEAWLHLGMLRQTRSELEPARIAFLRALEIDPELAPAHLRIATVYENLGDPQSALRHFQSYRRLLSRR